MDPDIQELDDQPTHVSGEIKDSSKENQPNRYVGSRIGSYQILDVLGEGGMGTVFLAEQKEPVQRKVALKLVRSFGGPDLIVRFKSERQAVASLDHPDIAKLLDVGTTFEGLPYFVMELIEGEPITTFCDRKNLKIHQRLELFQKACDAMAHAHSRGLIHRDIKPTNILVEEKEGKFRLKIIDFGLAKFLESHNDDSILTIAGEILGTPKYMSPEQASCSENRLDIRSDVFSLGVILFELLTGSTPIEGTESKGITRLLQEVAEFETVNPSSRVVAQGDPESQKKLSSISAKRDIGPKKLLNTIKGDLDWVVIKATDPDQMRRYRTCNDFSDDIGRYLRCQPVTARQPSFGYLVKKYVQKNRLVVTFLSILALIFIISMGSGWYLALWALNEAEAQQLATKEANTAKRSLEVALTKSEKAKRRATKAEKRAAASFKLITDSFEGLDPSASGRNLSAADAVWLSYQNSKHLMKDDPVGRASLLAALAKSLNGLGENQNAMIVVREALELFQEEFGSTAPELLPSRGILHDILLAEGKVDAFAAAFEESEKIIKVNNLEDSYFWLKFQLQQARLQASTQKPELVKVSVETFQTVAPEFEGIDREYQDELLEYKSAFASVFSAIGKKEESNRLLKEVLDRQIDVYGQNHPLALFTKIRIANNRVFDGKPNKGLKELEQAVDHLSDIYPENHPDLLLVQYQMARLCGNDFQTQKAKGYCQELIPRFKKVFGPKSDQTLRLQLVLARAMNKRFEFSEALKVVRPVVRDWKAKKSGHYLDVSSAELVLANCLRGLRRYKGAISLYNDLVDHADDVLGYNRTKDSCLLGLVQAYSELRQFDQAIHYAKVLHSYRADQLSADDFSITQAGYCLGFCYYHSRMFDEAKKQFEVTKMQAEQHYKKSPRAVIARVQAGSCYHIGKCLSEGGENEEAITWLEKAVELQKNAIKKGLPVVRKIDADDIFNFHFELQRFVEQHPNIERSLDLYRSFEELYGIYKKHAGSESHYTLQAAGQLTKMMLKKDELDQAEKILNEFQPVFKKIIDKHRGKNEAFLVQYRILDIVEKEKLAFIYRKRRNREKASAMLDKTLTAYQDFIKSNSRKNPILVQVYQALHNSKLKKDVWFGKFKEQLSEMHKSLWIQINNPEGVPKTPGEKPKSPKAVLTRST